MKVFVEQSFGKQYRPKWLWDQGAYKEWGKVRGVVFVGSRTLLRAGTLLRRGGRKSCCTFLLVLTHLLC